MISVSDDELTETIGGCSNFDRRDDNNVRELFSMYEDLILDTHDHVNYKTNEFGDDIDPDNHFFKSVVNGCEYYTDKQFKEINIDGAFTVIHFNSRSLYKNFNKIKEYLSHFNKFSVIAVSETWLDDEKGLEVEMQGYE